MVLDPSPAASPTPPATPEPIRPEPMTAVDPQARALLERWSATPSVPVLFTTRAQLFLACHREHCAWMHGLVAHAAARADGGPFAAIEASYAATTTLAHRTHLLFQSQAYACGEPEIRAEVASAFEALVQQLMHVPGSTPGQVLRCLQSRALLDVLTALASPWTETFPTRTLIGDTPS